MWQEYIFSGYFIDKKRGCQIRWEKRENNKIYCIYRISITYLEENLSLVIFKNVYQTHVTTQYLSEINSRKKQLFNEIIDHFNKKNRNAYMNNFSIRNNLKLIIAIKDNEDKEEENKNDLNMFIHNNSFIGHLDLKNKEKEEGSQLNLQGHSFLDNNNISIKEGGNLFGDSISGIEIVNSAFLFREHEDNKK